MSVAVKRIAGLDAVRAIAALSVMLAHVVGPSMPGLGLYVFTGHPAVIAFFVVSGFCIHYPYKTRELPIVAFWAARWIRIMIPAMGALAAAQALGIKQYNFIDGFILWSIVCEMFYYMAYPALLWLSQRVGWLALFCGSAILSYAIVVSLGSDQYGNAHIYGPWLNWLVALPSWLLGCILAEHSEGSSSWVWPWRAVTALTASVLYWLTINTPIGFYLTLNGFAILVAFWVRAEISAASRHPIGILEWIGTWSYSIYLVHVIAAALLGKLIPWPPGLAAASLLLCLLFYLVIERPSHELARRVFRAVADATGHRSNREARGAVQHASFPDVRK